jgi:ectoine hydroxylase
VSISIALTENSAHNGSSMIMLGSHRTFVSCACDPAAERREPSPHAQGTGTPDPDSLRALADRHGIALVTGAAGSVTVSDSNCMQGSSSNITPYPRSTISVVFNSVDNPLRAPYAASASRPEHIAARRRAPVVGAGR